MCEESQLEIKEDHEELSYLEQSAEVEISIASQRSHQNIQLEEKKILQTENENINDDPEHEYEESKVDAFGA